MFKKAEEQLKRLADSGRAPLVIENLSDYEKMIAAHLIHPQDITVSWTNIAGLDHMIQELQETVILPIQRKELFGDSQLTTAPKGVLLHGPPGCGKTLIAKATAKETNTHLINLEGWYGESQKLTAAVFTLAVKLQPCIIFIDEIDLFLAPRNTTNDEALAMLKGQFLSWWDGLITDPNCRVIVMGATNRPQDLDRAILRRMPATFHIPMPNAMQRMKILNLILENEPVAHDVDVGKLARLTDGFSESDLRELCRNGSVYRVRDYMKSEAFLDSSKDDPSALRPIMMEDLMLSLNKMWESKCTEDFYP